MVEKLLGFEKPYPGWQDFWGISNTNNENKVKLEQILFLIWRDKAVSFN
jgi:hypothetical protein